MEEACTKFRLFMESSGVSDAIYQTLLKLYKLEKKPNNSVEFLRQNLPPAQSETIAKLKSQLATLNKDIDRLNKMAERAQKSKKRKRVASRVGDETESVTTEYTETIFTDMTDSAFSDVTDILAIGSVITEATEPNVLSTIAEEEGEEKEGERDSVIAERSLPGAVTE